MRALKLFLTLCAPMTLLIAGCDRNASPTTPALSAPADASPQAVAAGSTSYQPGLAQQRVELCHRRGSGDYVSITIAVAAEAVHRAHGDAAVGEDVPGAASMVFDANCDLASVRLLVQVTAGTVGTSNNYVGQSVTTPAGGPYNNLRFNWYTFAGPATAFGTLYLLSQEYLGTPDDLSPSTPGFIATSQSIVGAQYRFAPGVTILGGTPYWFYTDAQGAFVMSFFGSIYPGGDMYVTGMPALAFHKALASSMPPGGPPPGTFIDANFLLQGTAAPTP